MLRVWSLWNLGTMIPFSFHILEYYPPDWLFVLPENILRSYSFHIFLSDMLIKTHSLSRRSAKDVRYMLTFIHKTKLNWFCQQFRKNNIRVADGKSIFKCYLNFFIFSNTKWYIQNGIFEISWSHSIFANVGRHFSNNAFIRPHFKNNLSKNITRIYIGISSDRAFKSMYLDNFTPRVKV